MFRSPCCLALTGSSGSGKTTFLYRVLREKDQLFSDPPKKILYCHGVYQNMFDSMERDLDIEFVEGIPSEEKIEEFANGESRCIVLDDLMTDVVESKHIQHLFTRGSHHKNLTVVYLNQNMYCQGKFARTLAINTQYLVIFKSPRDCSQLGVLGRQIGVGRSITEAYLDIMSNQNYGYLLVDLSPHNEDGYLLKTNIFPGEDIVIYTPV